MLAEHRIVDTHVVYEGQIHKASYYVESGIIHANLDGQLTRLPLGHGSAEAIVKAVVLGTLDQKSRLSASQSRRPTHSQRG